MKAISGFDALAEGDDALTKGDDALAEGDNAAVERECGNGNGNGDPLLACGYNQLPFGHRGAIHDG